jgi:hypothetical protein
MARGSARSFPRAGARRCHPNSHDPEEVMQAPLILSESRLNSNGAVVGVTPDDLALARPAHGATFSDSDRRSWWRSRPLLRRERSGPSGHRHPASLGRATRGRRRMPRGSHPEVGPPLCRSWPASPAELSRRRVAPSAPSPEELEALRRSEQPEGVVPRTQSRIGHAERVTIPFLLRCSGRSAHLRARRTGSLPSWRRTIPPPVAGEGRAPG